VLGYTLFVSNDGKENLGAFCQGGGLSKDASPFAKGLFYLVRTLYQGTASKIISANLSSNRVLMRKLGKQVDHSCLAI
jgi:hypothetical protein